MDTNHDDLPGQIWVRLHPMRSELVMFGVRADDEDLEVVVARRHLPNGIPTVAEGTELFAPCITQGDDPEQINRFGPGVALMRMTGQQSLYYQVVTHDGRSGMVCIADPVEMLELTHRIAAYAPGSASAGP